MPEPRSWYSMLVFLVALALLVPLSGCGEGAGSHFEAGEQMAYAVSSVFIAHEEHERGESMAIALQVLEELRGGASFADVAQRRSDDPITAARGGFMGFLRAEGQTPLSGALQVLPMGQVGGPLLHEKGFNVLYRHTHEEGARLEREYVIPVYGLFVPWVEVPSEDQIGRDEAERRAAEARQKLVAGELDILEAAKKYSPSPPQDLRSHIANAWEGGEHAALYDALKDVEPGKFAPVLDLQGAFGVLMRGHPLRSVVRHIMVMHSEGPRVEGQAPPPTRRSRADAEEIAKKVLAQAEPDGGNWFELNERYTDDELMVPLGGLIGSFGNGDLHTALEEVILETPPGQVASRLAESPGAFHVLWRVN